MNPTAVPLSSSHLAEPASRASFRDYLELTKPRLSFLSVTTAVVGYFAATRSCDWVVFIPMLAGTSFAAAGVASLNQWMERDTDALMKRTADRPIPSGRVNTGSAFVLGWALCAAGLGLLFAKVNGLATLFALATIVSYLALYTPAKRWSRWSTEIGAVAGAFPPLIGSAAATGPIQPLGWILFGVLLFWQIPHFMAIAWTYRRDYETVNFPMLPVRDASGKLVARWSLLHTVLAVAAAVAPCFIGQGSVWYLGTSLLLGAWFIYKAVAFLRAESREKTARSLFFASITWLPLQLVALVADRWIFG